MVCLAISTDEVLRIEALSAQSIKLFDEIDLGRLNFPGQPTVSFLGIPGYDIPVWGTSDGKAWWRHVFPVLNAIIPKGWEQGTTHLGRPDTVSPGKINAINNHITEITDIINGAKACEDVELEGYLCFQDYALEVLYNDLVDSAFTVDEAPSWRWWRARLDIVSQGGSEINLFNGSLDNNLFISDATWNEAAQDYNQLIAVRASLENVTAIRGGSSRCDDDPPPPDNNDDCDKIVAALENLANNNAVADKLNDVQDELTAVHLELEKIKRATGVYEFFNGDSFEGFQVPANIKRRSEGYRTIESIPDHLSWAFCQLESLIGNFPRKITVKDTEIDEQGNQEAEMELPNIAESLAELYGLLLNTDSATDGCLNASMRILSETMSNRQLSIKTYYEVLSLIDFFGFAQKPLKKELWLSGNLKADRTDRFLEPQRVEIVTHEYDESKEVIDFQEAIKLIATTYGIVASANLHKVNPNESKELFEQIQGLNDKDDEDDFDLWTERAEAGFTDAPGISDLSNPYGRKFERRPRIKNIDPTGTEDIP